MEVNEDKTELNEVVQHLTSYNKVMLVEIMELSTTRPIFKIRMPPSNTSGFWKVVVPALDLWNAGLHRYRCGCGAVSLL
jgi:hypothetical protein